MDRKAWIVIALCVAGIIANFYYGQKSYEAQLEEAKRIAAEREAARAVAAPEVDPASPAVADETAPEGSAPATVSQAEEVRTLVAGSVTYEFSTIGGGIKTATLAEHDGAILNQHSRSRHRHEPVGAIRREASTPDGLAYKFGAVDNRSVTLVGEGADGLKVTKVFSLSQGDEGDDHVLDLDITIVNGGPGPLTTSEMHLYAGSAASLRPDELLKPGFFWNNAGDASWQDTGYFGGGWFSSEKSEHRSSFDRLRFGGVMSRFFATIVSRDATPDKPGRIWASRFLIDHSGDEFAGTSAGAKDFAVEAAVALPPMDVAPGGSHTEKYQIYMGPKEYHRLKATGGQRSFVMFYGWFTPISKLLTHIMNWMHNLTGNWGVAIILMTILIRLVLWPLQAKSTYSMKKMGLLAPLMKELQEKHKDDPAKQQQEMMKLYRDYGVNPIGGCLPMLLQIPIFFGFFRVLQYAAELRGQGFLWVEDLSMPDTVARLMGFDVNPLPLIMGVTMFLQMKVTPQPASVDKMQRRIFMLMPFLFLFFCYNFASALALYWTTQNIFAIFQTWGMKLYMPEPKLEKVERKPRPGPAPVNPFYNPGAKKKGGGDKKNKPPRLGG